MATAMNITVGPWAREASRPTPAELLAEAEALCEEWLAEADEEAQAILARADAQAAAIIEAARSEARRVTAAPTQQNDALERVVLPSKGSVLERVRRLFGRR